MKQQGSFVLDAVGPYDFGLSFSFYRRSKFESIDRFGDNCFVRPLLLGDIPVVVSIEACPGARSKKVMVRWRSPKRIGDPDGLALLVRRMLCLDVDLRAFYRHDLDPVMKKLTRTYPGFRPILTPNIFEAAAWAIIGQQVTLHFAYMLKGRLVEKVNRSFKIDGESFRLFPSAEDIAGLDHDTLRGMQLSTRKAEYLLGFSRSVAAGEFDLGGLRSLDYDTAVGKLLAVRGIGPWSANYILMRGAGHMDAYPIGDSGINRAVKELYRLKKKPDVKRLNTIGDNWRPYRSLACFYLWKSL